MRGNFLLATILMALSFSSLAQEKGGEVGNPLNGSLEEYYQALNSDPRFDRLKKAAAGDKISANDEVGRFASEYCTQTKKCSPYPYSDYEGEIAVKMAKIHLKTIELSNKKYAEALIEFNKQLSECEEKAAILFTQNFKESCSEEIVCDGKKAEGLYKIFEEYGGFEKSKVGVIHRELSEEEKMVDGVDISFMLNRPAGEEGMRFENTIDSVHARFSMAPVLFSSPGKSKSTNLKALKFSTLYTPEGIMSLRALKCGDQEVKKDDKTKTNGYECRIFIGNTNVDFDAKEKKSCLLPNIASFTEINKTKKNSAEINDSDRGKLKAVDTETSGIQRKASNSSER